MWIETLLKLEEQNKKNVTPHAGVWIETSKSFYIDFKFIVTPHAGVWIETVLQDCIAHLCMSLPMRECGLKLLLVRKIVLENGHSPCGSVD